MTSLPQKIDAKPPGKPATASGRRRVPKRASWLDVPLVDLPVFLVPCPRCGSHEHTYDRSEPNGDGTTTRKAICVCCGQRFKIVATPTELPKTGNGELDIP